MVVFAFLMMRMMRNTFFPARCARPPAASGRGEEDEDGEEDRALSILRQRYAHGEIELEEYERRVEPLLRHEPARRELR